MLPPSSKNIGLSGNIIAQLATDVVGSFILLTAILKLFYKNKLGRSPTWLHIKCIPGMYESCRSIEYLDSLPASNRIIFAVIVADDQISLAQHTAAGWASGL